MVSDNDWCGLATPYTLAVQRRTALGCYAVRRQVVRPYGLAVHARTASEAMGACRSFNGTHGFI